MESVHRVYFNPPRVLLGDLAITHQRHSVVVFYAYLMLRAPADTSITGRGWEQGSCFLSFSARAKLRQAQLRCTRLGRAMSPMGHSPAQHSIYLLTLLLMISAILPSCLRNPKPEHTQPSSPTNCLI